MRDGEGRGVLMVMERYYESLAVEGRPSELEEGTKDAVARIDRPMAAYIL